MANRRKTNNELRNEAYARIDAKWKDDESITMNDILACVGGIAFIIALCFIL